MAEQTWSVGDRVLHPSRPEWGAGRVTAVQRAAHAGRSCQKLTIRFDAAGTRTVSTAFVHLQPVQADPRGASGDPAPAADAGAEAPRDRRELFARLAGLPPEVTNRSTSASERLAAGLAWYRFEGEGRGLLDWSIARSGVADPLAELSRQDLEQAWEGFFRRLDHAVGELARDLARHDATALAAVLSKAPVRGRQVLLGGPRRR